MVLINVLEKVQRRHLRDHKQFSSISNMFFSWLRSRAALEGYRLLTEEVSQNKITFLAVDVLVVNGCFLTKTEKKHCCPFPH